MRMVNVMIADDNIAFTQYLSLLFRLGNKK